MSLVVTITRKFNLKKRHSPLNLTGRINFLSNLAFVPKCEPAKPEDVDLLKHFINNSGKICVVTGAGISTESGIPDYRSEGVGLFATSDRRPVAYQEFCRSDKIRRRYWARNYAAWPRFSLFEPNLTHKWLKNMEDRGKVSCVITQNVDYLHKKAGSQNVIELHGTGYRVMCMGCNDMIDRFTFQKILDELNPDMTASYDTIRPDGDVDLTQEQIDEFKIPPCGKCGGIFKPDIVFFGDNVPRKVVEQVKNEVEEADSLLVLGSSLSTFSGYRIVLQANDAVKPVAIVNIGNTRADDHAQLKIRGRCGEILSMLGN